MNLVNDQLYTRKDLLGSLKEAGLPYTNINFIIKYERMICHKEGCKNYSKPFLDSPRDHNGDRIYKGRWIKEIIKTAKDNWFTKPRHFHWIANA